MNRYAKEYPNPNTSYFLLYKIYHVNFKPQIEILYLKLEMIVCSYELLFLQKPL